MKQSFAIIVMLFAMNWIVTEPIFSQSITLNGFVAGSSLATGGNGTYNVLGETFTGSTVDNGFDISQGLAQAQLERETHVVTVNQGEGYTGNGFSVPPTIPLGLHQYSSYVLHGANHKYDLLKTLKLNVIQAIACGELLYDVDLNEYPTVAVAGYCWTQKDMAARHYADGITEIAKALVYKSPMYPNETENENIYGRLYTWYSAVNVPESSNMSPSTDVNGFVQGICPDGWHIPTGTEMEALLSFPAEDIRSTNLWLQPNTNTNSTNFTALPAGYYNSSTERFEGLRGVTDFWTDQSTSNLTSNTLSLQYFCGSPLWAEGRKSDAWSVRCVKNY